MKLTIRRLLTWIKHFFISYCDPRAIAVIGITYFCQCNCSHCGIANYRKSKKEELSKEELIKIINQLPKNKIKVVYFFGGEPLLRNDIFELINCAHKRGFTTLLDTNGYLLSQEVSKKLKNAGLKAIGVSIDNPSPKTHDSLRGIENLFERATKGIKNCLNEKIICYLSTYVTKEKLKSGDMGKMIALGEKLGVDFIKIISPIPLGKWSNRKGIKLNYQERQLLKKICRTNFVRIDDERCEFMIRRLFYISPYGEVQPCPALPFSFGNIKEEPLGKIFKKMWKHPMFNMKIKKECPINNEGFQKKYFSKITPSTKLPIDL